MVLFTPSSRLYHVIRTSLDQNKLQKPYFSYRRTCMWCFRAHGASATGLTGLSSHRQFQKGTPTANILPLTKPSGRGPQTRESNDASKLSPHTQQ